jgi:hypothetical protein
VLAKARRPEGGSAICYLWGFRRGHPLHNRSPFFGYTKARFRIPPTESSFREELIELLKEYKDSFAWDYSEMPDLDRSIVEHRLPIKSSFKPYKQAPRKIYKDEVLADVKKEIERLLDANFIWPCRYAEWISNIVPVYKKNGKMSVCIDFRDLNRATPMDGYRFVG